MPRCTSSSVTLISFFLADFRENQTQTNATFGNGLVFFLGFLFGGVFIFEGLAGFVHFSQNLTPDILEFLLKKGRRNVELVQLVHLVEQLALNALAGHLTILGNDLILDQALEGFKGFNAQLGGEFVVEFQSAWRLNFLDHDFELGVLASQMLCTIFLRELDLDDSFVTGRNTDQLIFKARNELAGAKNQLAIFVSATFKGFAIDLAQIGHDHTVAFFGFAFLGFKRAGAFGDLVETLFNFAVFNFNDRTLDLDAGNIGNFDARQNFVDDAEVKVGLAVHDLGSFEFILGQLVLWLHRSLFSTVFKRGARGLVDQLLDDFTHQSLAMQLADMRCRYLAWAEAVNSDLTLDFINFGDQLGFEIRSRNHDFQFAFQTFGQGFSDLHINLLSFFVKFSLVRGAPSRQNPDLPERPISFQFAVIKQPTPSQTAKNGDKPTGDRANKDRPQQRQSLFLATRPCLPPSFPNRPEKRSSGTGGGT